MSDDACTFRAWRCHGFGDYHDLVIEDLPRHVPGAGEIVVRNHAFAVGFPDLLTVRGQYHFKPALPFTPGIEFAGEVTAVGAGVARFAVGDRVMGMVRGTFAAEVVAPADACLLLPEALDFASGAAFLVGYKTAHVGLIVRGTLRAGETVLVHGAAGGVGLAAVELAKRHGAHVIAMATGAHKLAVARERGAHHVFDYADGPFRTAVKDCTGGRGADVIYDPIGGEVFDESLHCVAPLGRVLVIGFAGGRIPAAPANHVLIKQYAIIGVRAGEYGRIYPEGGRAVARALDELAASGEVRPHIHARLPFEALGQAFADLEARRVIGRVVVEIPRAAPAD